jgi:hypothetical protein
MSDIQVFKSGTGGTQEKKEGEIKKHQIFSDL